MKSRIILRRITKLICLFFPVAAAFSGYFMANRFTDSEVMKFLGSLVCFALASTIVFVKTRNTNPIIKIRASKNED